MIVYLTHPDHGVHIAYSDQEVETCKKNGWSVRGEARESFRAEQETLSLPKRRGRPPKGDRE